ncbi:MAG: ATP-binding protein [Lachnospiraceae bacterium]|nr:ATP-binding protein [Lachnospiraceae bacterium]
MKKSIFRSICFATAMVFMASLILIMGVLYDYFSRGQQNGLKAQAGFVTQAVEREGISYFEGFVPQDTRVTWIAPDGSVLYDSDSNADRMENHLNREEIKEALSSGYGESARYSTTLLERQLYAAQRLSDGSVIRLSDTHLTVVSLILAMIQPILIVGIVAVSLAFVLASGLSKKIVKPLNELNLDEPQGNRGYEELKPLFDRVDSQQRQLKEQAAKLRQKQEEFITATDNMNEGLVLLNDKGIILSMNRTASRLLSVSPFCIGKDILLLNNSLSLQELLQKGKGGEHSEITMQLGGTEHQINASPVVSDGTVTGIALLIFDVSEKEKAEKMRREFTANVSHELKTPLHSISGYAELMKNGIVKQEDLKGFSEQIYSEAQRMITLVDDIIRLSRLDEGTEEMKWEETELNVLAEEVVRTLQPLADAAKVAVTLEGEPVRMKGIPQLLTGIIYNLCDNAVKYNRENGSVSVEVKDSPEYAVLSVSDTGIGIPKEHTERIFERFYRVDKSRSKEVGGTGLGLSIVKHSAKIHNAQIEIQSVVDGGTTVTVRFPK